MPSRPPQQQQQRPRPPHQQLQQRLQQPYQRDQQQHQQPEQSLQQPQQHQQLHQQLQQLLQQPHQRDQQQPHQPQQHQQLQQPQHPNHQQSNQQLQQKLHESHYPPEAVHAQIADTMLNTSLQLTSYLENYLEKGNPAIINISLELVKNVNLDLAPHRVRLLTSLLLQNTIKESEFPIFCHICICKLVFNGLTDEQNAKMKDLQCSTNKKLFAQMKEANRFEELTNLCQNFVNTFYANL